MFHSFVVVSINPLQSLCLSYWRSSIQGQLESRHRVSVLLTFFSSANMGGRTLQSISSWMCCCGPAATLLRVQAASFWMEDLGYNRSRGSTLSIPASMASWVWWSVPVTMFPTVRREGVWKNKARSVTKHCKCITVEGDSHTRSVPSQGISHALLMALWKPVDKDDTHGPYSFGTWTAVYIAWRYLPASQQ